jgi:hypothetical protein
LPRRDGRHAGPSGADRRAGPAPRQPGRARRKPQPQALRAAQKDLAVLETDWLIVLDCDEFINIKAGDGRLPDLIGRGARGDRRGSS